MGQGKGEDHAGPDSQGAQAGWDVPALRKSRTGTRTTEATTGQASSDDPGKSSAVDILPRRGLPPLSMGCVMAQPIEWIVIEWIVPPVSTPPVQSRAAAASCRGGGG